MGFFDKFKRQQPPIDSRQSLIDAAGRQDWKAFASLCQKHQEEIRKSFREWTTVPQQIRGNAKACDRYVRGLMAVASCFEQAGDRSLIEMLTGNKADNPVIPWQEDLAKAHGMLTEGRAAEVVELLESTLKQNAELSGPGADELKTKTLGALGSACFKMGDRTKALECMQSARELCAKTGDAEGVRIYEGNIAHIQNPASAKASKPPEVVFKDKDGKILTAADLQNVTGSVEWEIGDDEKIPEEARALHEEGRAFGQKGEFVKAAAALERASQVAPDWPHPVYDLAYTRLLEGKFDEALAGYARVDQMAPRGFFTTKTALWTLEREKSGQYLRGTYLAYLSIEWAKTESEKRDIAKKLVEKFPDFAPGWKELGVLTKDSDESFRCFERGLSASPDAETYGMLAVNKALRLFQIGKKAEALNILGDLAMDPKSSLASAQVAKATLANLINSKE
jgi:tetratricopeptide (TPR) repeat protein